jgi:hypothetical protein
MLGLGYVGLGIADPFPSASAPSNAPSSPPFDQPNPRGPLYPIELRTFLQSTKLTLIGQDTFFGHGGPNYDWPNPRGYAQPIDLKTWMQSTPLNLVGKDKFYGLGGPSYDYPNPRAPQRSIDLINFTSSGLALTRTIAPPLLTLANYDFPNPRGPQRSIDALSITGSLNIPLFTIFGTPALVFSVDRPATLVFASDSPSGQGWKGAGYMAKYEIDSSVQINGDILNSITNIYVDPTGVTLFILDPTGAQTLVQYPGPVTRDSQGHYHYTISPSKSGTWTYKWQATGSFVGTSPDTTFVVNPSILIAG